MPIKATRFDYILSIILFVLLIVSFFLWSRWGDLHYCTNPDPAKESQINMAVYIIPLFLIYEMFTIYYFNGMPRLREIDKGVLMLRLRMLLRKKMEQTREEYHQYYWKKKL